jgi:REP element-mobilizing transposase RayT
LPLNNQGEGIALRDATSITTTIRIRTGALAASGSPSAEMPQDAATQAQLQSEWQDLQAKLTKIDLEAARRQAEIDTVKQTIAKLDCYYAEADYLAYLEWMGEASRRAGCQVHAYALMTNHVYLLVTPGNAQSVPRMMVMVAMGRKYVPYINVAYQRSGILGEWRYQSALVQSEAYLLACMRAIELNPVRAAMCQDPADYRLSSHRANALGEPNPGSPHTRCTPHWGLTKPVAWLAAYRALFDHVRPRKPWPTPWLAAWTAR